MRQAKLLVGPTCHSLLLSNIMFFQLTLGSSFPTLFLDAPSVLTCPRRLESWETRRKTGLAREEASAKRFGVCTPCPEFRSLFLRCSPTKRTPQTGYLFLLLLFLFSPALESWSALLLQQLQNPFHSQSMPAKPSPPSTLSGSWPTIDISKFKNGTEAFLKIYQISCGSC